MSKSVENIGDEFPRLSAADRDSLNYELQACQYLTSRLVAQSPVKVTHAEQLQLMLVASNLVLATRLSDITDELMEIKFTQT